MPFRRPVSPQTGHATRVPVMASRSPSSGPSRCAPERRADRDQDHNGGPDDCRSGSVHAEILDLRGIERSLQPTRGGQRCGMPSSGRRQLVRSVVVLPAPKNAPRCAAPTPPSGSPCWRIVDPRVHQRRPYVKPAELRRQQAGDGQHGCDDGQTCAYGRADDSLRIDARAPTLTRAPPRPPRSRRCLSFRRIPDRLTDEWDHLTRHIREVRAPSSMEVRERSSRSSPGTTNGSRVEPPRCPGPGPASGTPALHPRG